MDKKIKVIYIAGEGRSGSTLLERILGQHPQIFAAGELKHIWERSFIENQLCSCGKPFNDCPVWQGIVESFLEKRNRLEPQSVIEAFKKTSRIRHYIFGKNLKNCYSEFINDIYTDLYRSILENTKKEFVIDASKHPVFAHILAQNKKIVLYVIHLIRDVRGVAYSWTKKRERPEITHRKEYMPRYSVVRTALSWSIVNKIASDLKVYPTLKYIRIFYEELVSNPKETLEKIYKRLEVDLNFNDLFLDDRTIVLKTNHTVSGNPFRFKVGKIKLSPDIEWKSKLPFYKKILVNFLSHPTRNRIGL